MKRGFEDYAKRYPLYTLLDPTPCANNYTRDPVFNRLSPAIVMYIWLRIFTQILLWKAYVFTVVSLLFITETPRFLLHEFCCVVFQLFFRLAYIESMKRKRRLLADSYYHKIYCCLTIWLKLVLLFALALFSYLLILFICICNEVGCPDMLWVYHCRSVSGCFVCILVAFVALSQVDLYDKQETGLWYRIISFQIALYFRFCR